MKSVRCDFSESALSARVDFALALAATIGRVLDAPLEIGKEPASVP